MIPNADQEATTGSTLMALMLDYAYKACAALQQCMLNIWRCATCALRSP
jgi:hypothetical protein